MSVLLATPTWIMFQLARKNFSFSEYTPSPSPTALLTLFSVLKALLLFIYSFILSRQYKHTTPSPI